jgi:hypothetical protein
MGKRPPQSVHTGPAIQAWHTEKVSRQMRETSVRQSTSGVGVDWRCRPLFGVVLGVERAAAAAQHLIRAVVALFHHEIAVA